MKSLLVFLALVGVGLACFHHGETEPMETSVSEDGRISTISTGDEVTIEDHLDPEGWTVVEFGAVW